MGCSANTHTLTNKRPCCHNRETAKLGILLNNGLGMHLTALSKPSGRRDDRGGMHKGLRYETLALLHKKASSLCKEQIGVLADHPGFKRWWLIGQRLRQNNQTRPAQIEFLAVPGIT